MYSHVADMLNTFSRVEYFSISILEDISPYNLPSSAQKLLSWSGVPDPGWVLLLHIFAKCPTSSQVLGVTILDQSLTWLTTVWLTDTFITQVTIACSTNEFSDGLFEVLAHIFHCKLFITC